MSEVRPIDANGLHDTILRDKKLDGADVNWAVNRIITHIDNAPTIEPTTVYEFKGCDNCELERPKGKWLDVIPTYPYPFKCSVCGHMNSHKPRYCSNCGSLNNEDVSIEVWSGDV